MKIDMIDPQELLPADYNPRKIDDVMLQRLADGIREYGLVEPVLCNKRTGRIIGGHQRTKAAIMAGVKEVPVHWIDVSEDKEKALNLALNKISGEWDEDKLGALLADMNADELAFSGFGDDEISELIAEFEAGAEQPKANDDAVPPIQEAYTSVRGDVWVLGRHRLMCGDSTSIDDVKTLMAGVGVDMVFTDPPYNVDYQGSAGSIKNDNMSNSAFHQFLRDAFVAAYAVMEDGAPIYVSHADGGEMGEAFRTAFVAAGFKLAACLIWKKNMFTLGRSDYQWIHEPILYGWKDTAAHKWYGGRKKRSVIECSDLGIEQTGVDEWVVNINGEMVRITGSDIMIESLATSVIYEDKPKRNDVHPTMKPVALIEQFLQNSSKASNRVLDLFGGSGSTLIACHKLGRSAYLMELDERFVDVIIKRWQEYTGKHAVHAKTGKTFEEMSRA